MKEASALYRLLGDEARLRLLRVLDKDRFNVKELTGILGLAQSGVSRHLGLLKESELVVEERDGAYSLLPPLPAVRGRQGRRSGRCCSRSSTPPAHSPLVKADESRLQEVLRLRRENFEHAGPDTRDGRQLVPGPQLGRMVARARPAAAAARRRRSRLRRRLSDRRDGALGAARDRRRSLDRRAGPRQGAGRAARLTNITWKKGELEKLPLETAAMDVALLSQALHHAADPARRARRSGARPASPAAAC